MSELISKEVKDFIQQLLPERTPLLQRIEQECHEQWIPLIEPEVARFLQVLLQLRQPLSILEIGTGFGYSAMVMGQSRAGSPCHITSIEIDSQRYEQACLNIAEAGLTSQVTLILGDAHEVIPSLTQTFDFIFIDAAKGQYPEFMSRIWPLLQPGGVILFDNIFLNGWVISMTWPERRKKTMVCRVRSLLENLKDHPDLMTTVMPLGDGLALCVRR